MFSTVTHNTTTSKESVCRIMCTGTPENGGMVRALPPLAFQKGSKGAEVLFHYSIISNCMVIKIDLNQIYRSYSGTQKIQNDFL